jgi:choloylglycine hydrolase
LIRFPFDDFIKHFIFYFCKQDATFFDASAISSLKIASIMKSLQHSKRRTKTKNMCTALIKKTKEDVYLLRNLDDSYYLNNEIIITPKNYSYLLKGYVSKKIVNDYEIWGIGRVIDEYPLYFDCVNEHGLSFAALAFKNLAVYQDFDYKKLNLAPYELPLYLLGKCKNIKEVTQELAKINILNFDFSKKVTLTPLHFIFGDKTGASLIVEPLKNGIMTYKGGNAVLTNAPSLKYQFFNLSNYQNLSNGDMKNNMKFTIPFSNYSFGLGAYGLPGDYSSSSRFVKANYLMKTCIDSYRKQSNIYNLFNILSQVSMPLGAVYKDKEKIYETTVYSVIYSLKERRLYLRKINYLETMSINIDAYIYNKDGNELMVYPI